MSDSSKRAPSSTQRAGPVSLSSGWPKSLTVIVLGLLVTAVVIVFVLRAAFADTYRIPSASMEPMLMTGDRIEIDPDAYSSSELKRGDVIVFDSSGSFADYQSRNAVQRFLDDTLHTLGLSGHPDAMVKRVIGTGGDTVECCTAEGRMRINGEALDEPYLAEPVPPGVASRDRFTVNVPEGRMFVLGDNRHASEDSRALLGAPGGGMIPESKILGRYESTR